MNELDMLYPNNSESAYHWLQSTEPISTHCRTVCPLSITTSLQIRSNHTLREFHHQNQPEAYLYNIIISVIFHLALESS